MERFIDAAELICTNGRTVGARSMMIMLHRASGPVGLAVDTLPGLTEAQRLHATTREYWEQNPVFARMREHVRPIGGRRQLALPIIVTRGWIGTLVVDHRAPITPATERDIAMLATHLSVWCTDRGVGFLPDAASRTLGPRQREIARLAASGRTNAEIAHELAITINTVKMRLKQVFDRLQVASRIELVTRLRQLAPLDEVARGVTQRGGITITRARDT